VIIIHPNNVELFKEWGYLPAEWEPTLDTTPILAYTEAGPYIPIESNDVLTAELVVRGMNAIWGEVGNGILGDSVEKWKAELLRDFFGLKEDDDCQLVEVDNDQ